jgi:hypothetical protein
MNKEFITHFKRKTGGINCVAFLLPTVVSRTPNERRVRTEHKWRNHLAINFLLTNNHFVVSKTSTTPPQTSASPAAGKV